MRKLILLLALLAASTVVLAANDPGHDSLYVEEQGDSELNGTFNVTENQSIKGGELSIFNQFILRGDGNEPASNLNYIVSDHGSGISINTKGVDGVLRLQDTAAAGLVQLGDFGTSSVDLNVSNNAYILGSNIELGTNFIINNDGSVPATSTNSLVVNGSGNQMWLTSNDIRLAEGTSNGVVYLGDSGLSDSILLNISGDLVVQGSSATVNGAEVCTASNGLCASGNGTGEAGGWNDTGSVVQLITSSDDVDANTLYVDNSAGEVGIGTNSPSTTAHIFQNSATTSAVVDTLRVEAHSSGTVGAGFGAGLQLCNERVSGGTDCVEFETIQTATSEAEFAINIDGNRDFYIDSAGDVGIGTESPDEALEVLGNIRAYSGDVYATNSGTTLGALLGGIAPSLTTPSIVPFRTDSDTGIGAQNSDGLSLVAGGVNVLNIFETGGTGQVGIGTSNPNATLHVAGDINVTTGNDICIEGGNCLSTSGSSDYQRWRADTDTDSPFNVNNDTLVQYLGGDSITTSHSGTDITIDITDDSIDGTELADTITLDTDLTFTGTIESDEIKFGVGIVQIGEGAGNSNTGDDQTVVGFNAGNSNSGSDQIGLGSQAGYANEGNNQIAIGYQAGYQNSGNDTIFIGRQAGFQNSENNVFILRHSQANTTPLLYGKLDTNRLTIGNASTPTATLDVHGDIRSRGNVNVTSGNDVCIEGGNCLSTAGGTDDQTLAEVLTEGSTANDGQTISIDQINARDTDGLALYDDANNGIFIEDGGNVGVGTTDPTVGGTITGQQLFTVGFGSGTYSRITSVGNRSLTSGYNYNSWVTFSHPNSTDSYAKRVAQIQANVKDNGTGSAVGQLQFDVWNNSGRQPTLVLDSGKAGIGLSEFSTPTYTLDVAGTGRFTDTLTLTKSSDPTLIFNHSGGSDTITMDTTNDYFEFNDDLAINDATPAIHFIDTGATEWQIDGGNDFFKIEDETSPTEPFIIEAGAGDNSIYLDSTGNVGIGQANPGEKLHVNGSINVTTGNDICIEGGNCLSTSGSSDYQRWRADTDTNSPFNVNNDTLVQFLGGTSIDTSHSGTDITIDVADDSIDGTELADTITLDNTLAINGNDLNIDSNTLFVDVSENKVGIGTTNPSQILHVSGNAQIDGDISGTNFYIHKELTFPGDNDPYYLLLAKTSASGYKISGDIYIEKSGSLGADTDIIKGTVLLAAYTSSNVAGSFQYHSADRPSAGVSNAGLYTVNHTGTHWYALRIGDDMSNGYFRGIANGANLTILNSSSVSNVTEADFDNSQVDFGSATGIFGKNIYTGNGITKSNPESGTIQATGASGANIQGANLTIAGGRSTGGATPGNILFQTSNSSAGGAYTLQALSTKAILTGEGNFGIGQTTAGEKLHVNGSINVTTGNDICIEGGNCLSTAGAGGGSFDLWRADSDTNSPFNVNNDTLVQYLGGDSITTSHSGTDITIDVADDSIDGTELADTITLDNTLAINGNDVNINGSTLFVDSSEDKVAIGHANPSHMLHIDGDTVTNSIMLEATNWANVWGELTLEGGNLDINSYFGIDLQYRNSSVMRIQDGTVGIGTNDPGAILDIQEPAGNSEHLLRINDTDSAREFRVTSAAQLELLASAEGNSEIRIQIDGENAERFQIKGDGTLRWGDGTNPIDTNLTRTSGGGLSLTGGSLGIGTDSPTSKLHVEGGANFTGLGGNNYYFDPNGQQMVFNHDGDRRLIDIENSGILAFSLDGNGNDIHFVDSSSNDVLYLEQGGNVGIGTDSPSTMLDVEASDETTIIAQATGTNSKANVQVANDAQRWGMRVQGNDIFGIHDVDGTTVPFQILSGGAPTNSLVIDAAGEVGVGTNSPGYTLEVAGSIKATMGGSNTGVYLGGNDTSQPKVGFRATDDSERFRIHMQDINTAQERLAFFKTLGGEAEVMSVMESRRVGIETNDPQARLEVDGGIRMNTADSKPSCTSAQRGTMWFEQSTSGTDDFMYACMRNSSDGYNWVMVARGG